MSAPTEIGNEMFGKAWWSQPLAARYASIDAHAAGLTVQVEIVGAVARRAESPRITWRGTNEKFAATKAFPRGVTAKSLNGRFVYPGQLRGTVYPDGQGSFVFVIESCSDLSSVLAARHAKEARTDERYLNFRDAVMAGFPMAEDGAGAA
jgi:hypothetical protein